MKWWKYLFMLYVSLLVILCLLYINFKVDELARYSENCLQKPLNEVPNWCWEDK